MQTKLVLVKNVSIYAYSDNLELKHIEIISKLSGVYTIKTIGLNSFFELNLTHQQDEELMVKLHHQYYALGETEEGNSFITPRMFCVDTTPSIILGRPLGDDDQGLKTKQNKMETFYDKSTKFKTVGILTNINVSERFSPPNIGQRLLIKEGVGRVIAAHKDPLSSSSIIIIDEGEIYDPILKGPRDIIISGIKENGDRFIQLGHQCITDALPHIFIKKVEAD
ncbi:hypothetical protein MY04_4168 [Flammeovirga sp. MY04]|uniref:hypothetical protein n=1 Tax=Flammeovirga sp. MY04 TaxID=1191459 RepID=UPI000825B5DB|nr:hypothetical protein [Flammeovirga sp. MY04]ANQ51512.2 hypothetical protein MY04_4168 [Flammeovirga sp. MY04]